MAGEAVKERWDVEAGGLCDYLCGAVEAEVRRRPGLEVLYLDAEQAKAAEGYMDARVRAEPSFRGWPIVIFGVRLEQLEAVT